MSELPSGTVTFVFTDIEDSTELLKRMGDAYASLLSEHRRIVRDAFAAYDGIEIDTQGDAFFFVFPRARDAVAAAVDAQRAHAAAAWPDGAAVRVRMGLHTGEPAVHEEGYVGLDVVRAARLCTTGHGGQILLSEATRALLGSGVPEGVSVFPLGQRHLRGIDEPERVYELAIEGLEEEAAAPEEAEAPVAVEPSAPGRIEDLGPRLAAEIQEKVLQAFETKLQRAEARRGKQPDAAGGGVDDLAERVESLKREIDARVRAALERKGISSDPS